MANSYQVIDVQSSKVVGEFKSRKRATDMADRKDRAYGAVRFIVKPIWA